MAKYYPLGLDIILIIVYYTSMKYLQVFGRCGAPVMRRELLRGWATRPSVDYGICPPPPPLVFTTDMGSAHSRRMYCATVSINNCGM